MCDTMVALSDATADGSVLFAKNSDRDPNEVHELVLVPAIDHQDQTAKCTYIEIPQVRHTYSVFLCKPFWIWGAEMGANEHGVVIGNEAVFSKIPAGKEPGLIGMDFLRLALERASTADEASQVIIELLEEYGQSGNCGYEHPLYYHNSYLIADKNEALILETVEKEWALKKVGSIASISNRISIQSEFDQGSENLVQQALDRGWCSTTEEFNFHKHYSDMIYTRFSDSKRRNCETYSVLDQKKGSITEEDLFALLRHHRNGFPSSQSIAGANVCMHAGYGPIRGSQSTGSLVARINENGLTLWVTGTSAPCMSIFKPVWFDGGLPGEQVKSTAKFNPDHMWWQHELLHRAALNAPEKSLAMIKSDQEKAEAKFLKQAKSVQDMEDSGEQREKISESCFSEADELTHVWTEAVQRIPPENPRGILYRKAWEKRNRKVNLK